MQATRWLVLVAAFNLLACAAEPPGAKVTRLEVLAENVGVSSRQYLFLKGVKSENGSGFRVFVNPSEGSRLDSSDSSYAGSVYFSHRNPLSKGEDFALALKSSVWGKAKIVLSPISSSGDATKSSQITVREAAIRAGDNSSFQ